MERRQLLFTGAAAALTHTAMNLGCGSTGASAGSSTVAAAPNDARKALAAAARECVSAGEVCLSHCLKLLASGDTSMGDCSQSVRAMLAVCRATAELANTDSELLASQAKVCAEACAACAKVCEPHRSHHAECGACFDACRKSQAAAEALG